MFAACGLWRGCCALPGRVERGAGGFSALCPAFRSFRNGRATAMLRTHGPPARRSVSPYEARCHVQSRLQLHNHTRAASSQASVRSALALSSLAIHLGLGLHECLVAGRQQRGGEVDQVTAAEGGREPEQDLDAIAHHPRLPEEHAQCAVQDDHLFDRAVCA